MDTREKLMCVAKFATVSASLFAVVCNCCTNVVSTPVVFAIQLDACVADGEDGDNCKCLEKLHTEFQFS